MLNGSFVEGLPTVDVTIWCHSLNVRSTVSVGVDTFSAESRISARILGLNADRDFPLDDSTTMVVVGGPVRSITRPTLLSFEHEDGRITTALLMLHIVDDAPGESRLGRDVLNEWLMVYDAPAGNLFFESVEA